VAFEICRLIGREAEYPGYIVVYNWSKMLIVTAQVLVWLPALMGIAVPETSHSLDRIVHFIFLIYLWFIARAALRIDPFSAIGMVFTSYVLSFVLDIVHNALLKPAVS
jgi:hypothetical protein